MTRRAVILVIVGLTAVGALAFAVARLGGEPAAPETDVAAAEVVLAPATRPLDEGDVAGVEILSDRLVIPVDHSLSDVEPGQVLALGVTDQTPNGMLRYVTAVNGDGDRFVAMTRQATLEETFQEADIAVTVPLTFDMIESVETFGTRGDIRRSVHAPGTSANRAARVAAVPPRGVPMAAQQTDADVQPLEAGFVVAFDEVLRDGDDDLTTTDDQVRAAGSITAVLDMELDIDVGVTLTETGVPTGELEHALVVVEGRVASNLQLEADEALSFGDKEELFAIEFSPILIPAGGLIVVLRPRMPVWLGWDGEVSVGMETSVVSETIARIGVEFDEGEWNSIEEVPDPEFDHVPPALDGADPARLSVWAGPHLEFRLWETLASGSVGIEGVVELELFGEAPWSCLAAGVQAHLGFRFLGESFYDEVVQLAMYDLAPSPCDGPETPPAPVEPVAGYSVVLGDCSPLGAPIGESARTVVGLEDGGVLVAAGIDRYAAEGSQAARFDDLWLVRLDGAGKTVWTRKYRGLVGQIVAVVPTGDGAVFALETGRLVFVDAWGELSSSRQLSGQAFSLNGLVADPAGGFLALGVEGQDPIVAKLGGDGSVVWAHRYTGDIPRGGALSAAARPDGGWTVALAPGYFAVLDSAGESQRAARLEINGSFDYQIDAAGLAGGGSIGVASSGTVFIVDRELETATGTTTGTSIAGLAGLADGGFATTGANRIARVGPGGGLAWAVEYDSGDGPGGGFRDVSETTDGGIVVGGRTAALAVARCGEVFDPPGSSDAHWDVWVLKVPPNGLLSPDPESGVRRGTFDAPVWDGTQRLVPVDLASEPFPLADDEGGGVFDHPVYPDIAPHGTGPETALRTIGPSTFRPRTPLSVTYEWLQGGEVSTRVTVVWVDERTSMTAFDATISDGELPQTFRIVLGPDAPSPANACLADGRCLAVAEPSASYPGFMPLVGITPNFVGPIPEITVTGEREFAGVVASCGSGEHEAGEFGRLGVVDVCIDEDTGAVLYAYARTACEDPDRTDGRCVELQAVAIDAPSDTDFILPP